MECIYCASQISPERAELKPYCLGKSCVDRGLAESRAGFRLVLVPKQGFTFVRSDDTFLTSGGRSSGKQ